MPVTVLVSGRSEDVRTSEVRPGRTARRPAWLATYSRRRGARDPN
jgi:hypothetical protein